MIILNQTWLSDGPADSPREKSTDSKIPLLPVDSPSCFWPVNLSSDWSCREMMLNEKAGDRCGRIWKFHPSNHSSMIAEKIAFLKTMYPFDSNEGLQDDLISLQEYVDMWIIEDDFVDHNERRDFRDSQEGIYAYYKKHSKLRRNVIGHLPLIISCINRELPDGWISTSLSDLCRRVKIDKYDDKTFAEKAAYAHQIDAEILQFLNDIIKKFTPQ